MPASTSAPAETHRRAATPTLAPGRAAGSGRGRWTRRRPTTCTTCSPRRTPSRPPAASARAAALPRRPPWPHRACVAPPASAPRASARAAC
eukprot:3215886-Prymnesium_polylepis.1